MTNRALPKLNLALLLGVVGLPAFAVSDIDVVYGDDIARRGEVAAELAARWSQTSRASADAGRTLWQAVGELSYGLSDGVSVGIKLPVTRVDGRWRGHGAYAEVKYLAPHDSGGFYWGAEIEAGSIRPVDAQRAVVLEVFPILGYRVDRFHLIGNPGIGYSSKGEDMGWGFSPKAKLSYLLNDLHAVGIEYHVDAGRIGHLAPRNDLSDRRKMAYLIWDARVARQKISVALGHGATHASDRWAVRVAVELDD